MPPLIPAVIVGLFLIVAFAGVVDALRQPDDAWHAAEQSRATWIKVMLVLPPAGIAYWGSIRPQLSPPAAGPGARSTR
ncbi:MAG: hypothetical protein QOI47_2197 [Actinomycetota bacterium]|nr:hypothetical protein [Actinomycetota bacterium]